MAASVRTLILKNIQERLFLYSINSHSSDYYSLTITGVIKANKNEKISLYLEGKGDALYSMSQDSSFAVVYLSPLDDYYTQGMQIMLQPAISQAVDKATTWHILRYWTHQRPATTAPILFSQGNVMVIFPDKL